MARAIDRKKLAEVVLKPLGLPVHTVGSHLALAGQQAYADSSGALGSQDTNEARALLTDAGWVPGGPLKDEAGKTKPKTAGSESDSEKEGAKDKKGTEVKKGAASEDSDDGTYIGGESDQKPGDRQTPSSPPSAPPPTSTPRSCTRPTRRSCARPTRRRSTPISTRRRPPRAAPRARTPRRGRPHPPVPPPDRSPRTASR